MQDMDDTPMENTDEVVEQMEVENLKHYHRYRIRAEAIVKTIKNNEFGKPGTGIFRYVHVIVIKEIYDTIKFTMSKKEKLLRFLLSNKYVRETKVI